MSASGGQPETDDVEMAVGTPVLDVMSETSVPTPSNFCGCFVDRVRDNVRQRRTKGAVAQRVASNITTPITQAFELEVSDRVQRKIEERLER
jgi:hypothetical protein